MKRIIKPLSFFLSILILLSSVAVFPSANRGSDITATDFGGRRIIRTVQFFKAAGKVLKLLNAGSTPEFEFHEGAAIELCNYIAQNSAVDVVNIVSNVPAKAALLEKYYTLTDTDTTALRDEIYKLRDEAYQNDNEPLALFFYFLGAYMSVIEKVDIFTVDGDDGITRVGITATFMDGSDETIITDIYFSPDGLVYGPNEAGLQFLGFECSVYDLMIYATVNCWMKDFGFCLFYDFFCYITPFFNYNTRRYKFEYGDREWMVQAWKGNYLVSNGAEVGIYSRDKDGFGSYYDCYDGVMPMGLRLSHGDGTVLSPGDGTVIFEIEQEHWWINGFKLSNDLFAPNELTAEYYIEMPDEDMALAFAEAVNSHIMEDATATVDGARVTVIW